jgi:putative ABC transport system ATP-binding protein
MAVLNAENIIKVYGGKRNVNSTIALNGVNLKIESKDFVAIMGPSGSGKTTLLNVLSGIDRFNSGKLEIADKDIFNMTKNELAIFRRQHLGFVFQEFNLLDSLTLKENVMLPMILDNKDPDEIEIKTNEVMTMLGINEVMNKYPYSVSGGQQQRTAICRAIINNPELVFADEPTGNLDSKSAKAVMECFQNLNSVQKNTILIVTHDVFAASYTNKVIFIKDGVINKELNKTANRVSFYDEILNYLSQIGGEADDN